MAIPLVINFFVIRKGLYYRNTGILKPNPDSYHIHYRRAKVELSQSTLGTDQYNNEEML